MRQVILTEAKIHYDSPVEDKNFETLREVKINIYPEELDSIIQIYEDIAQTKIETLDLHMEDKWCFLCGITIEKYKTFLPTPIRFETIKERITQTLMYDKSNS